MKIVKTSIKTLGLFFLFFLFKTAQGQDHKLIGYWTPWTTIIDLNKVDSRYDVIIIAFANPDNTKPNSTMKLTFSTTYFSDSGIRKSIQKAQSHGKKVLISFQQGTAPNNLAFTDTAQMNNFVSSMKGLISFYGVDGLDVDIEDGPAIQWKGGTSWLSPASTNMQNFHTCMQQLLDWYLLTYGKKMMFTVAPPGYQLNPQSTFYNSILFGYSCLRYDDHTYLPFLVRFKDDLDWVQPQFYGSGGYSLSILSDDQYNLAPYKYASGTREFLESYTEFLTLGLANLRVAKSSATGTFGAPSSYAKWQTPTFPANKIVYGLLPCNAYGDPAMYFSDTVINNAVNYVRGISSSHGSYTLQGGPYPGLLGLMAWTINFDQTLTCAASTPVTPNYKFAKNYVNLFNVFYGLSPGKITYGTDPMEVISGTHLFASDIDNGFQLENSTPEIPSPAITAVADGKIIYQSSSKKWYIRRSGAWYLLNNATNTYTPPSSTPSASFEGKIVNENGHVWGWNGSAWKQLDN